MRCHDLPINAWLFEGYIMKAIKAPWHSIGVRAWALA